MFGVLVLVIFRFTIGASETFDLSVPVADAEIPTTDAVDVSIPTAPCRQRRIVWSRFPTPARLVVYLAIRFGRRTMR